MAAAAAARTNLALMGAPGSGKGTYGRLLAQSFGASLVTSSDVLREYAKEHVVHMAKGGLIEDNIVTDALLEYLSKHRHGKNQTAARSSSKMYILDGFPRTLGQIQIMEDRWPSHLQVHAAVSLEVPKSVCRAKLLGRRFCVVCGGHYNVAHVNHDNFLLPPTLPTTQDCEGRCNQELDWIKRDDDHPEIVENRLDLYYDTMTPVLDYYESKHALLRFIPYNGRQDMPRFESTLRTWLEALRKET